MNTAEMEFKTETDIQMFTTIGTVDAGSKNEHDVVCITLKQDVGADNDGEYTAVLDVFETVKLINNLSARLVSMLKGNRIC